MKINESIKQELEEKILDYFVITSQISKTISTLEKLDQEYSEDMKNVKVIGELKKETYLYQFYNVFLVKNITNISLLYKLCKLHEIDLNAELEEKATNIIASDPETMVVEGGSIVIVDEQLKSMISNLSNDISVEEVKEVEKAKKVKKNEKGS